MSGPGAHLTVFGTSTEGRVRWLVLDRRGRIIHQREFGSLEVLDGLALAADRMVILAKERFHPRMLLMAWRLSLQD
ncbi:MAG: hypothetical protein JW940_19100 [Polyangiaceae bacterium]|nr:hypothetical protein [Polyangiaceae bacterium]